MPRKGSTSINANAALKRTPWGTPGNPAPGGKSAPRFGHMLRRILDEEIQVTKEERRTRLECFVRFLIDQAMGGNMRAAEMIVDRVDPKHSYQHTQTEAVQLVVKMEASEPPPGWVRPQIAIDAQGACQQLEGGRD